MRELTEAQVQEVSGGLVWLLAIPAICVLMGSGCAHTQPLRRGEKPSPEAG